MVIGDFDRKTVFLDTAPLIYYIEGNSLYQKQLNSLFQSNDAGKFMFITSSITLLEVLVKPLRDSKMELVNEYKKILTSAQGISIFEISNEIAVKAAQLRAMYNLRTPDALQYATAMEFQADYFLTNDNRLSTLPHISCVLLPELAQ
jgi:predicted nucleic acid-binding protein